MSALQPSATQCAATDAETGRDSTQAQFIDTFDPMELLVFGFFGLGLLSLSLQAYQSDDDVDLL